MDWSVGYSLDSSGDESVNLTPPPPEPSEEDEINVRKEDEDNGDDSGEMRVTLVTEVEVDDEDLARVMGVEQVEERGSRDSESFDEEIEIDEACMQAELACAKGGGDRVLREERAWPTPGPHNKKQKRNGAMQEIPGSRGLLPGSCGGGPAGLRGAP